ncbi:MAG: AI-2E family transporter [Phycisphaerales bacterium]
MSATSDWKDRHLWQFQPIRDVLFVLAIIAVLVLGAKLSLLTVPLLLALLLAYLLDPIITLLVNRVRLAWYTRSVASASVIAAIVLIVIVPLTVGLGYGVLQGVDLIGAVGEKATTLQTALTGEGPAQAEAEAKINENEDFWKLTYDAVRNSEESDLLNSIVTDATAWVSENRAVIGQRAVETVSDAVGIVIALLTGIGGFVFQAFLTAFFFFFISTNYRRVMDFLEKLIPSKNRARTLELIDKFDAVIAAFIRGRITIALIQSVFFSIGYFIVGVPAALLLGIATGVLAIVPYLALVSIPVAIALIYLDPPGGFRGEHWLWMIGGPIVVYQLGQLLDDYVLTPKIQGKGTNLDTPTVLFASIAGGILAGFYGLLIAIPVAACLKILIKEILWPKIDDWIEGRAKDPLPLSQSESDKNESD